jgi:hypothetical protein
MQDFHTADPGISIADARSTVEALLGALIPHELDDVTSMLLGTGRQLPTPAEMRMLGDLAARLPVLG